MLRLKSLDGVEFVVDEAVAFQSELIRDMNADCPDENQDMPIPLPIVHSSILSKIIEFCEYHRLDRPPLMRPKDPAKLDPLPPLAGLWGLQAIRANATKEDEPIVAEGTGRQTASLEPGDSASQLGKETTAVEGSGSLRQLQLQAGCTEGNGTVDLVSTAEGPSGKEKSEDVVEESLELEGERVVAGKVNEGQAAQLPKDATEETAEKIEMQPMSKIERDAADKAWNAKFIDVKQDLLFSLILASNYLNVSDLLELGLSSMGAAIKGKPPTEVRKLYGIPEDFDPHRPVFPKTSNKSKSTAKKKDKKKSRVDGSDHSMELDGDETSSEEEVTPPVLPPQRGSVRRPVRASRKAVDYTFVGEDID